MPRLRPPELFGFAGILIGLGVMLKIGLDPLLVGPQGTGAAETAGNLLVGAGGLAALLALMLVDPAWPLSLGVASMIFSSNWELAGSPLALDRILVAAGLLSLILRARRIRDVLGREPETIHWLLLAAAIYALLSAAFASTIGDRAALFGLLDRYGIVPFILFAVAPAAFPDARRRRILLGTLTVVGAYLVYVSILAKLGPRSLVFPDYIVDPSIGIHADRARGPFVESVANGLALFECGVAAVFLSLTSIDRRVRIGAGLVAAGSALCIVLTVTRSVWVGSAVGLLAALLVTQQTRRLLVPTVGAVVAMILLAFAFVPGLRDDASFRESDQRPIWDRENANAAAVRMIEERPIVGFGWFTFTAKSPLYQRLSDNHILTRSGLEEHNVFLSNAVELGLLGTALWGVALFAAIGTAILRRGPPELGWWRVALVAIAVQWFVVANFVPLGYAFPNALLWLWAGVVCWRPEPALDPEPVDAPAGRSRELGMAPA
jgi:putative inorganic carbon (HCO3(-)) transporter